MHEIGMCEAVVAAVEARARGRPVSRVRVRAGAALRVVPDAFQQAFTMVAAGGAAADAVTDVLVLPVTGRCRACGTSFESLEPLPACSRCGSIALDRNSGDELILESVEYGPPETAARTGG